MELSAYGLSATMPPGWEGAISQERDDASAELARLGGVVRPVAHLATFPLPADRGDFGSGAVEHMRARDAFVALLEYGGEAADTPLFARRGMPRRLDPRRFHPRSLQRSIPGQAGLQEFFTDSGRPFCLYVVIGDADDAHLQAARIREVLAAVRIETRR